VPRGCVGPQHAPGPGRSARLTRTTESDGASGGLVGRLNGALAAALAARLLLPPRSASTTPPSATLPLLPAPPLQLLRRRLRLLQSPRSSRSPVAPRRGPKLCAALCAAAGPASALAGAAATFVAESVTALQPQQLEQNHRPATRYCHSSDPVLRAVPDARDIEAGGEGRVPGTRRV